jgi:hypothetical protein
MSGADILFRNVDVAVDDPVESWPVEAINTALERGSLQHWARIAAAVRHDPWGPVARSLEQALDCVTPYGVSPGMQRVLVQARLDREAEERRAVADEIRALVADSGFTAAQFASRLGTSASRLSTYLAGKVTPSAALMVRARGIAPALTTGGSPD